MQSEKSDLQHQLYQAHRHHHRSRYHPEKHMTHADYVKKSIKFWFDGDAEIPLSQWVVRRVKHEKNVFTCARVSYPRYFQDQTWITLFL